MFILIEIKSNHLKINRYEFKVFLKHEEKRKTTNLYKSS